jgi:hypothetical protein
MIVNRNSIVVNRPKRSEPRQFLFEPLLLRRRQNLCYTKRFEEIGRFKRFVGKYMLFVYNTVFCLAVTMLYCSVVNSDIVNEWRQLSK